MDYRHEGDACQRRISLLGCDAMTSLISVLPYIEVALAVLLVAGILLQRRGAATGSAFGGGDGTIYGERRGAEKWLFTGTFVTALIFISVALIHLILG